VPFIGLIKKFLTISTILSQKNEKIAYIRNGKDAPNIQIGITSVVYKISTQILRV